MSIHQILDFKVDKISMRRRIDALEAKMVHKVKYMYNMYDMKYDKKSEGRSIPKCVSKVIINTHKLMML